MWVYIRFVQKILITLFLTLTYFLIIPFSWLFMVIFHSGKVFKTFKVKSTYWQKLTNIDTDLKDFTIQS